jgi:hypothetical protein
MLDFWLGRSVRSTSEDDIQPGSRYRRRLCGDLRATATVLDLRPDMQGIPHVHFTIAVDGSSGERPGSDTRVLALRSFRDTYPERMP